VAPFSTLLPMMNTIQRLVSGLTLWGMLMTLSGCVGASVSNSINVDPTSSTPFFPTVHVSSLEGTELALPAELPSESALVVLGFAHEQRAAVGRWMEELQSDASQGNGLALLEIPVIDEANMALRTIIRNGMRTGITDTLARERTLPLFVNRDAFCRAIGVTDLTQPAVVLLTRAGTIAFTVSGDVTPERVEAVRKAATTRWGTPRL